MLKKYLLLCLSLGLSACPAPVPLEPASPVAPARSPAPSPSTPTLPTASPTMAPTAAPPLSLEPTATPAPTIRPTPTPVVTVAPPVLSTPTPAPTSTPTPTPTPLSEPSTSATAWGEEGVLFSNLNDQPVQSQPIAPSQFTLAQAAQLTYLETYHWNEGQGAPPGTLALLDQNGKYYGPWPVRTRAAQPGQLDIYWYVNLNLELLPGTYTVLDSDAETWSYNAESDSRGMLVVRGRLPAGEGGASGP